MIYRNRMQKHSCNHCYSVFGHVVMWRGWGGGVIQYVREGRGYLMCIGLKRPIVRPTPPSPQMMIALHWFLSNLTSLIGAASERVQRALQRFFYVETARAVHVITAERECTGGGGWWGEANPGTRTVQKTGNDVIIRRRGGGRRELDTEHV
jgi:hypothetical protein